jgi:uncharacterized protein (DUF1810 family)
VTADTDRREDPATGLARFIAAQDPVYAAVCAELSAGAKASHWMWFVFPQLRELGRSAMARHFGIVSRDEARAYWRHPVLGQRLKHCTGLVLAVEDKSAFAIFGTPDDLKFRSCMTLFAQVAPEEPVFEQAIAKFFNASFDERTLALLRGVGLRPDEP